MKYEDQLAAARYRAERDQARQELARLRDEMEAMRPRLMPDGMEWPRFEDGEPVAFRDKGLDVHGHARSVEGVKFTRSGFVFISDDMGNTWWANDRGSIEDPEIDPDKRVKRPAPKVLDADGEEIREGDTVWHVLGEFGPRFVSKFETHDGKPVAVFEPNGSDLRGCECDQLTHRAPVLAADGRPLREGETVWHIKTGREYVVVEPSYGKTVVVRLAKYDDAEGEQYAPDQLTHERPEIDTWERIEEDAEKDPCGYFGFDGKETCGKCPASGKNCEQTMARDLVRRCRALSERGE